MDAATLSIIEYLGLSARDTVIVLLPLAFDYGLYQLLMTFKVGGTVVLQRGFDYPDRVRQILKNEKVSFLPIVPTIADMLLRRSQLEPLNGLTVRAITNTAAPLTAKHIDGLVKLFPNAAIYAMYGLTECKRVSYLPPNLIRNKLNSVGIPMRGVSVCIADDHGNTLPPGQIGELLIQGPNVMQGYWKDPETTKRVFRRDPATGETILHSGDLFRQDEEGFLYFVARKDDMLKIHGERVYPLEVEKLVQTMPGIRECAVLGVTGSRDETCLAAAVVPIKKKSFSEDDLRLFCRESLEPYLIPKIVFIVSEIPKLPNGKIDKQRLRTICQETDLVCDCQMPNDMILPSNQLKTTSGVD
jgi:acyl-CoA synthetase (AMP-forming)/AMP-acid ligase II